MISRLACVCLVMLGFGLCAAAAQAGPPGTWTRITGMTGGVQGGEEIGLERTSDGRLHVDWTSSPARARPLLLHSALSGDARRLSGPDVIYSPTMGLNNRVDLVAGPGGGLRAFFGSLTDAPFSDRMGTATAGRDGRTWTVQRTPASNGTPGGASPVYAASGISGLSGLGGVPISMWGDSAPGAGGWHVGVDQSSPDFHFQRGCCASDPNAGREAGTGRVFYGFNRQGFDSMGRSYTRAIVRTPEGSEITVPNSQAAQLGHRFAITGRLGMRGVYVAYTAGDNTFDGVPALWRVGDREPQILSHRRGARHTSIAASPRGRVWVFWAREGRIYAGRSSPRGTPAGRILTIAPPRGTQVIRNLTGDATRGPLDLFAMVDRGSGGSGYWHQRLLPSVAVNVVSRGRTIVVRVSDAGRAVAGAVVRLRIGSRTISARSGADGRARLEVGSAPRGTYQIRAEARGFSNGLTEVRIG